MDNEQLQAYVERIGLEAIPPSTVEGIALMQRAHLETVPFENLDILADKVPLELDEASLFDKIVVHKRGGICYELNYLYAEALRAMGLTVHLMGGRIYPDGNEYDHVFLMIDDPQDVQGERWLTDVGFAYNYASPLRFEVGLVQEDGRLAYRIDEVVRDGKTYYHLMRLVDGREEFMFEFEDVYRDPHEFDDRLHFFETSDDSRFRKGPLVCIDGEEGRITLSMRKFIETRNGVRTETEIDYPGEFDEMLSTVFKMKM